MPHPGSKLERLRFIALWLLAGVLEGVFVWQLGAGFWLAVVSHLLAAGLLFFAVTRRLHSGRWFLVFPFFAAALPVVGWAMAPILLFGGIAKTTTLDFTDEHAMLVGAELAHAFRAPTLSRREQVMKALDFIPLSEILATGDLGLMRGAVEKLAQLKSPDAIRLLLEHRSDPVMEMRFYVTSALTRIKKEYDEELEAAKQDLKKSRDPVRSRQLLVRVYLQYAASGLVDEATVAAHRREALYHLGELTNMREIVPGLKCNIGRMTIDLHLLSGAWDEGLKVIDQMEREGVGDPGEFNQSRIDILYRQGRFGEVRQRMVELKERGGLNQDWQALAAWWGG